MFDEFKQQFILNFVSEDRWRYLANGLLVTLKLTLFAVLLGLIIGFTIAIIRNVHDNTGKLKVLNFLCNVYLTIIRGTPVVVQLLIIYFVIFGSVRIDKALTAILAFGINSGAYQAEIFRAGIQSIPRGQMEAGRSLGFSYFQTMALVIMPQAIRNVIPTLLNEFITLLKETSVAGYIALEDLTKGGDIIRSRTYSAFMPLIAVALIYLVMVLILERLVKMIERRLNKNDKR
ncbi:MAG: amino acid ABC transporter permease [Lachnospiraceae bacterium]|nr:amino acid ABC transporter permease [Lachnospiraceae bacterium]